MPREEHTLSYQALHPWLAGHFCRKCPVALLARELGRTAAREHPLGVGTDIMHPWPPPVLPYYALLRAWMLALVFFHHRP